MVISGFDWLFFEKTRNHSLHSFFWPAVTLGFFLPIFGIPSFYAVSVYRKSARAIITALAIAQAALFGIFASDFLKLFTGRPGPPDIFGNSVISDTSRVFHFGLYKGGLFFGWPSSHTAVAFAMAFTIFFLYPRSKMVRLAAILYAFYIGIGVSVTIHWFSDFAAGAIIGTVIGVVVGKNFTSQTIENRQQSPVSVY